MSVGPTPEGSRLRLRRLARGVRPLLRLLARAFSLSALGCAVGGFFLGRALPVTLMAPFGVAFAIAVRAAGLDLVEALPTALAVVLGLRSMHPAGGLWWATVVVLLGQLAVGAFVPSRRSECGGAAPVAGAVLTVIATGILGLHSVKLDWMLIFWCGMAGATAMLFSFAVSDFRSGRVLTQREPGAFLLFLATVACALWGLDGSDRLVVARNAVITLLVLLSASSGGVPMGAAAGSIFSVGHVLLVLGRSPGLRPHPDASTEAVGLAYVFSGMLAGAFRELGGVGTALGYGAGLAVAVLVLAGSLREPAFTLAGAGLGALVFLALPARWVNPAGGREPGATEEARGRLLAHSLLDRVRTMSRALKEVSHTFEQVASVGAPAQEAEEAFGEVARRVCHSCSLSRDCWKQNLERTQDIFIGLWAHLETEGPVPLQPLPEALQQHCIYPDRIALALNDAHEEHSTRLRWGRQLNESRMLARDYVSNVARLLDEMAEAFDGHDHPSRRPQAPLLRIVMGCAGLPKRGGHITGDSILSAPLGIDRHLLVLSDGMGVGSTAAWESRQCVTLLQTLLEAGFATEVAIQTVNSVLLLHTADEKFATLDVAILDLASGRTEFVKIGAAPSFIKRKQDVTVVKVASVPVGIVSQVEVEPEFRLVRPGDTVIMVSDGVWDVARAETDKERWLLDLLEREPVTDPETMAQRILAGALDQMPDVADDMTVMVARVESIPDGRSAEQTEVTAGWAPVSEPPRFSRRRGTRPKSPKGDES